MWKEFKFVVETSIYERDLNGIASTLKYVQDKYGLKITKLVGGCCIIADVGKEADVTIRYLEAEE